MTIVSSSLLLFPALSVLLLWTVEAIEVQSYPKSERIQITIKRTSPATTVKPATFVVPAIVSKRDVVTALKRNVVTAVKRDVAAVVERIEATALKRDVVSGLKSGEGTSLKRDVATASKNYVTTAAKRDLGTAAKRDVSTAISDKLSRFQANPSEDPYPPEVYAPTYPMYPPLGTLGPYGSNWFPEEYKNNHRNTDRSSTGTPGVEILSIEMPSLVRVGDTISLTCHFRLLGEGQKIYTVNWWRDKDQFYTYNTEKHNNKSVYQFDGIHVDARQSDVRSVVLLNVSRATNGAFKCEVMTEAPAFKTAVMYKNLTVVVPPRGIRLSPRLPALARYSPGETVERNCTAGGSIPRTELHWTINGSPATALERVEYPDKVDKDGRITSTTGIKLVTNKHFHRGVARVRCTATINGEELTNLPEILYADTTATVAYNTHLTNAGSQQRQKALILFTIFLSLPWRRARM